MVYRISKPAITSNSNSCFNSTIITSKILPTQVNIKEYDSQTPKNSWGS
jgi:hypothetical protein